MTRTISFTLNGEQVAAEIKLHHNLVEVLQREFNLMGARESCGQGMCGCCTVLVNGAAVSGCLYLAAFVDGAEVRTVESLADARTQALSPVQEAFIEAGAFQCGYCTPGFLLMARRWSGRMPIPTGIRSGIILRATSDGAPPNPRSSPRQSLPRASGKALARPDDPSSRHARA